MKKHSVIGLAGFAAACAMSLATAATPAAQSSTGATDIQVSPGSARASSYIVETATVVAVDAAKRDIELKRQNGESLTINVGEQVRNFAQIKVGDKVKVQYAAALSISLKKSGTKVPESGSVAAAARAPLGAKPAAAAGRQVTLLADVMAIDSKNQTVTLKGPKGNVETVSIADPAHLKDVKKGDKVEVVYTEALAVSVEAAAP